MMFLSYHFKFWLNINHLYMSHFYHISVHISEIFCCITPSFPNFLTLSHIKQFHENVLLQSPSKIKAFHLYSILICNSTRSLVLLIITHPHASLFLLIIFSNTYYQHITQPCYGGTAIISPSPSR